FAGALDTYCIEALMQDGKALQAGTSHFLGQNFAKAFDVKFTSKEGKQEHVWATSWGVSTRLMGALIMAHSDDAGLVLPPKLAPIQVVIVPIYKGDEDLAKITKFVDELTFKLKGMGVSVKYDSRDSQRPGFKFAEYELKGVPIRLAIGARDMENGTVELARRDTKEKFTVQQDGLDIYVFNLLNEIQENIYKKAYQFREEHITEANSYDEFKTLLDEKTGFISAHWDGTADTEKRIKEETKATIRCIPLNNKQEDGVCIVTGKPSIQRVLFARAY
ncbi:MAG: proline--tRNA ligase, partial [Flavobacterium sp.]